MATLTTKERKEIKWDEIKAAAQNGELPEGAEIGFTLKNGESVSLTVAAAKEGRAFLVFSDCVAQLPMYDEWPDRPVSWKESDLRRWANEEFIKRLPDEFVAIITPRDIVQIIRGERMETRDLLWAPSSTEIFGKSRWAADDEAEEQFPIFTTERGRVRMIDGETYPWWTRSPYTGDSLSFRYVYSDGSNNVYSASDSYGVVLGLCV